MPEDPPIPDADPQYFYLSVEGQQQGPIPLSQLRVLLTRGTITPDRYVWREGLAEWKPARELPEVVPPQTAAATHTPPPPPTGAAHAAVASPPVVTAPPTGPIDTTYNPGVRDPWGGPAMPPASITERGLRTLFRWWVVCISMTFGGLVTGLGLIIAGVAVGGPDIDSNPFAQSLLIAGFIIATLATLLTIAAAVVHHMLIYQYWRQIQDGHAETTPGKGTFFLLIPMFQYYWMFVAYWGLAKDLNAYADRHNLRIRRPSPGLALGAIITMLAGFLVSACLYFLPLPFMLIPWFIMMLQLHRASLDIARTREPEPVQHRRGGYPDPA